MATTDYSTYLKIDELLQLQVPLSEGAHDELLFIVVHQSYELWFKVILDELTRASRLLWRHEPWLAVAPLRRVVTIEDLLLTHLRVLETMSPEGFLEFRDPLDPASGFQSFQFRAIEFVSGGGKAAMLDFALFSDETRAWLRDVAAQPHVWDGFCDALAHYCGGRDETSQQLTALYHDHVDVVASALHQVAELLLDHDERLAMWRHQHYLMAGRQIGRRPGTGGSEGMAYLATTLAERLYPALWEVRSVL